MEIRELEVARIQPSAQNLRKFFDPKRMDELKASIKEKGLVNPIKVRPVGGGRGTRDEKYEIVYGERRWRSFKDLGLKTIPAIVQEMSQEQALEFMVIENLQRNDLNAMEEAAEFEALLSRLKWTRADLASRVGKSEDFVTGRIKLLQLPPDMQKALAGNEILPGHGAVLLRLKDPKQQRELYQEIVREKLSVRSSENELREYSLKLEYAKFDKTECLQCDYNGDRQKDMFCADTDLKGECLNRVCYLRKANELINAKVEAAKKQGIRVLTAEEERKQKSYIHMSSLPKGCTKKCDKFYYFVDDNKGQWNAENRPLTFEMGCLDKRCHDKLFYGRQSERGESFGNGSSGLAKAKVANLVKEAKRRFWIKTVLEKHTIVMDKAVALKGLIDNNHSSRIVLKGVFNPDSYGSINYTVKKLYELGEKKLDELTRRAVDYDYENMWDDQQLEFLAKECGVSVVKDWTITEEYLKAHTKEQLVKIAVEIGLLDYLREQDAAVGKAEMLALPKPKIIAAFLNSGFKLAGKVPKEMK